VINCGTLTGQGVAGTLPAALSTLTFAGAGWGTDQWAGIYNFFRATNGPNVGADSNKLRIFELPVFRNTSDTIYIPDGGQTGGGFDPEGTYEVVRPAAVLGTPRLDDDLVIKVDGCFREGLLNLGPSDRYLNPRHTFTGIATPGWRIVGGRGITFDRCSSLDHRVIVDGASSEIGFFNCRTESSVFFYGSSRVMGYLNNPTGGGAENACYEYPDRPVQSKQVGIDIHMGQRAVASGAGGFYIGGPGPNASDVGGHHVGHYRAVRGISSYNSVGLAAVVVGEHSSFYMHDGASLLIRGAARGVQGFGTADIRLWGAGVLMDTVAQELALGSGSSAADPVITETLANWAGAKHSKNWSTGRGFIAAGALGGGVPAADVKASGCGARIRE